MENTAFMATERTSNLSEVTTPFQLMLEISALKLIPPKILLFLALNQTQVQTSLSAIKIRFHHLISSRILGSLGSAPPVPAHLQIREVP